MIVLQQWLGFINLYVGYFFLLVCQCDNVQGGFYFGGCQVIGVVVGQQLIVGFYQCIVCFSDVVV